MSKNVLAVQTDVTQSASVQNAVKQAEAAFGPVDVLVNNAGINVFCDPLTMSDDDWRRCFAVDLTGCGTAVVPCCRAWWSGAAGSIVNIASTKLFLYYSRLLPLSGGQARRDRIDAGAGYRIRGAARCV